MYVIPHLKWNIKKWDMTLSWWASTLFCTLYLFSMRQSTYFIYLPILLFTPMEFILNILQINDYGRMMAISQNIFGQIHTYLGFLKSKVFCRKNNRMMDKRPTAPKWVVIVQMIITPKFIRPICPFGPKAWDIIE